MVIKDIVRLGNFSFWKMISKLILFALFEKILLEKKKH